MKTKRRWSIFLALAVSLALSLVAVGQRTVLLDDGAWYLCGETTNTGINLWNQTDLISGTVIPNSDGQNIPETALYFGIPAGADYDTGKRVRGSYCIDLSSYLAGEAGSEIELGFKHWRDVEFYPGGTYDKTWVSMSADNVSWTPVDGLSWDSRDTSSAAWLLEQVKTGVLVPSNEHLWLRFCFDSVDGYCNDGLGWLIREITVLADKLELELDNCPLPNGYVGEPYDLQMKYSNGTAAVGGRLTITGLPSGLKQTAGGKIIGTPRRSGIFRVSITAADMDVETCNLVIQEQRCFFREGFEDVAVWVWSGLWARVGPSGETFGNPGAAPCAIDQLDPGLTTNNVAYYGNVNTMNYDTGNRTIGLLSLLGTPAGLNVAGVPYIELSFDSCRTVEQFSGGYDQTKVQVRFNTSNEWFTVWYKDSSYENSGEWESEVGNHGIPFSVPGGASLMWIRFVFDSADKWYNGYFGWMIDNILVCGEDNGGPIAPESSYMSNIGPRRSSADELSVTNFPNPVTDVHTTTFTVRGVGVEAIRIQIFDQNETLVFEQQVEGQDLEWHTDNNYGEYLANGTYYYLAYARIGGEWIPTKFEKVVILR